LDSSQKVSFIDKTRLQDRMNIPGNNNHPKMFHQLNLHKKEEKI